MVQLWKLQHLLGVVANSLVCLHWMNLGACSESRCRFGTGRFELATSAGNFFPAQEKRFDAF
ncbi:MAG TPA: hypothetical protein DCR20_09345 [Planctomycetaceae bacterium]|nr:hypothetical protein [Planctomycetaceae bacterium]HCP11131.1 hypothetical protein [Planctomycetaceae bacterium]